MTTKNIPIVIVSFNRLTCLKLLLDALMKRNYTNIIIIDNNSTYEPLLTYYQTIELHIKIIRCSENYGHKVLNILDSEEALKIKSDYFVYTDPDIIPIKECPEDFLDYMMEILIKYDAEKVGFGLKIDDLPDQFKYKADAIEWESKFWTHELEPNVYQANIDTTFALCKPNISCAFCHNAIRLGYPYMARHLWWYYDLDNLPEDEIYYKAHKGLVGHWSSKS